ncbi:hypothetical protein [Mucilaginibacter mallensis]|nr:hypothetical protein [Mucilaginibacter mallensis]
MITLIAFAGSCYAQEQKPSQDTIHPSPGIDIFDVLRKLTKKPAKPIDTPRMDKSNLSFLPVLGYSPANGVVLGAAVSVTKYMGDPNTTKLTTALLNASVTTKNQVITSLRYDLYTSQNKWYISGDNRLLFFTQPTYGLNNQPLTHRFGIRQKRRLNIETSPLLAKFWCLLFFRVKSLSINCLQL